MKKQNDYLKYSLYKINPKIIKINPNIISDKAEIEELSFVIIPKINSKDIKIESIPIDIKPPPVFLVSLLSIIMLNIKKGCSFILSYHNINYKHFFFKIFLEVILLNENK
jgi:hypothetical protein